MSNIEPRSEPAAPLVRSIPRPLLAVDIEGYSAREPRQQVIAQLALLDAMETAAKDAELDRGRWLQQVSGDGVLAVLPNDVDIVTVVGRFAPALERALAAMPKDTGASASLRVRLALHHGTLITAPDVYLSPDNAPVAIRRLLDSRPLRRYLTAHPERNVALIVSDLIFNAVVSGSCALPPEHFRSIRARAQGPIYRGHIYDPGQSADENSRGGDLLTASAPAAPVSADEPFDERGAELYQRVLEQAQQNPPSYDVEAELGRLTDWMSAAQRPRPDAAETGRQADDIAPSPAPGSIHPQNPGFLEQLAPLDRTVLLASAREVVYPVGAVLWAEGQPADHIIVIKSGAVRVSVERDGRERIIALRGPGDILGERAALMLRRRSATVVAMDTLHALLLSTQEFVAYLSDHPRVVAVLEHEMYDRMLMNRTPAAHDAPPGFAIPHPMPIGDPAAPPAPSTLPDQRTDPSANGSPHPMPTNSPSQARSPWSGSNCTILFTDIVGFSSFESDVVRIDLRRVMYRALKEAFEDATIPWDSSYIEDRGDGALIIVPAEVPAAVIDPMLNSLGARLGRHNRESSGALRVQLRVAMHVGPVMPDPPGISGSSIITTARLLDAPPLKDRLATTGADLGVIASRLVYYSVIVPGPGHAHASEYERVTCRVRETDLEGWIRLYGLDTTTDDDALPATRRRP
ncbi:cyclic nucleotide-binding domain-containing protein [Actinomadura madurae]|uniref:cyclic nucleotide-binding domain-containing protein n=1 Tax=Actinomadura madurae TaxID=1993 RepID=UPI0020D261C4|nr:cyclic nucleotide-binding domain-containing protein [Actinomadura madurae]MCP9983036.1 cyclic nucleotide-binding domain-containing protein [Actinomadura madurae]